MDIAIELSGFLQKGTRISDRQAREVASLLIKFWEETKDETKVSEYIMSFAPSVCLCFFEQALEKFGSTEIKSLHTAIRETEAYKKNKNHAGTTRGFIIAAVLIKDLRGEAALNASEQKAARVVLALSLADALKNGKASDTLIKNFKRHVLEYCGEAKLNELGSVEWPDPEMQIRSRNFMLSVNHSSISPAASPASVFSAEAETARSLSTELLKILESSTHEAQSLLRTLNESNGMIAQLHRQINERDARIFELETLNRERDAQIDSLHSQLTETELAMAERQNQITDLTERLKTSLHMDDISRTQELLTLKKDLANSLKVEYLDYLNNKDVEWSPDTFGACLGSLNRIFRTLRRFDIVFD